MPDEPRRVYSVIGTLPEPGGYAIAKFSRSARPYSEWIGELTQEGASRFYEQFYFSYGHASIADLAHLTMVAENISIVAAVEVLDEQLVDAQESSTRYQDFTRRRYYTPPEIAASPLAARYRKVCDGLFSVYNTTHRALVEHFEKRHGAERPPDMADDEYRRMLRARALDVARYLLPSSTYTGLGYLCSARTLERQISRLASHPLAEMREIADELRRATTEPAYNPLALRIQPVLDSFLESHSDNDEAQTLADKVREATLMGAAAAPTLVRYTQPLPYLSATYEAIRRQAADLLANAPPDGTRGVELADAAEPNLEMAATLLYRGSESSYRRVMERVKTLSPEQLEAVLALPYQARGPHDDPVRETRVGYQLVFDLCLDNGAFRDLHRHRNCIQIIKDFTPTYGYDIPEAIVDAGCDEPYRKAMEGSGDLALRLDEIQCGLGQYALPLAFRRRALFKMDAAELAYVAEVRTRPAGHFSYREISYRMFLEFQRQYPALAQHIRVTDPQVEAFFER